MGGGGEEESPRLGLAAGSRVRCQPGTIRVDFWGHDERCSVLLMPEKRTALAPALWLPRKRPVPRSNL